MRLEPKVLCFQGTLQKPCWNNKCSERMSTRRAQSCVQKQSTSIFLVNQFQRDESTTQFGKDRMSLPLPVLTPTHCPPLAKEGLLSAERLYCLSFSQSIYNCQRAENYFKEGFASAEAQFTQSLASQYFSICGQTVMILTLQDSRLWLPVICVKLMEECARTYVWLNIGSSFF